MHTQPRLQIPAEFCQNPSGTRNKSFFYRNLITVELRLQRRSKNVSVRTSTKVKVVTSQNETPAQ